MDLSAKPIRQKMQKQPDIRDNSDGLGRASVGELCNYRRVDIDADRFDPGGEHIAGGYGV